MQAIELRGKASGMACIGAHVGENITLKGLFHMPGVRDWALGHAFRERFGIMPEAYIISYRLNWVRNGDRVAITFCNFCLSCNSDGL